MSTFMDPIPGFEPLPGLSAAISKALMAHPEWELDENDRAVCAGKDCDWVKSSGGGSTWRKFVNHQTFRVHVAVAQWYDSTEEAAA